MLVPLIRTLILYFVIIVAVRLMGKRQVGEMQPTELVITILVSAVVSVPMQDIDIPLSHGIIPVMTLISAEVLISAVSLRSRRFRQILTGKPIPVIVNGKIDQQAMQKLRFSLDDLCEDLRLAGVFDLRQVAFAQIETNGKMSILQNTLDMPLTVRQAGAKAEMEQPFFMIISDGVLCPEGLKMAGKTRKWLDSMVKASGAVDLREVFLLCANTRGDIICTRKGELS